jgi:hypothetical protein
MLSGNLLIRLKYSLKSFSLQRLIIQAKKVIKSQMNKAWVFDHFLRRKMIFVSYLAIRIPKKIVLMDIFNHYLLIDTPNSVVEASISTGNSSLLLSGIISLLILAIYVSSNGTIDNISSLLFNIQISKSPF